MGANHHSASTSLCPGQARHPKPHEEGEGKLRHTHPGATCAYEPLTSGAGAGEGGHSTLWHPGCSFVHGLMAGKRFTLQPVKAHANADN